MYNTCVIPQEYIIHKFYQYAGYPKYKKSTNVYEGGCTICREGNSWGRKRRLYFLVKDNIICCHNCGWYSSPADWIRQVSGLSWSEIYKETQEYDVLPDQNEQTEQIYQIPDLPQDSINMFDTHQLRYYETNPIVKRCMDLIVARRLDTAINRPKSLYLSLTDKTHKNRLIIPFYTTDGKVSHYQTRKLLDDGTPKYLSKTNNEKTLFNVDKLNDPDHVFIFEGPIDSFFVRDSVAVAGIQDTGNSSLTSTQQAQLNQFILSKRVWVLDNDPTGHSKSEKLLQRGESVFIWPKELRMFKDINDLCVHTRRNEVSREFILKNTLNDVRGLVSLKLSR